MMSRRKQQNPKPLLKYDEPVSGLAKLSDSVDSAVEGTVGGPPATESDNQTIIKDEPASPQHTVDPIKQTNADAQNGLSLSPTLPPTLSPGSLENLLGVPDDAPLKVQRCSNGGYKILSAKYIAQGAGLDPLKAQRIESLEDRSMLKDKPQIVSFLHKQTPEGKVYFQLESSINCGWLKCLGEPTDDEVANVNIYYAGDQLWVEVVEDLKEGQELVAEFQEHNRHQQVPSPKRESLLASSSASSRILPKSETSPGAEAQFPCSLCGVQFRNPNTLLAHKKHYCSKLASPSSTTVASVDQDAASASSGGEGKDIAENLQQNAYICIICKFMTLTESDMKSHVREKHKAKHDAETGSQTSLAGTTSGADKTYCDDCEIHFKKPESYQAHKQHYCKNRTSSNSPRSDNGGNHSICSSPLSPIAKEVFYKKVSVFDSQALSASFASQAAAAMAAASLPFTLSSMLSLPGMAALPMMPPLKMFQSPAMFAQAMQSAVKATSTTVAASTSTASAAHRDETPLDLTVKSDSSSSEGAAAQTAGKRRTSGDVDEPHPHKLNRLASDPASPVGNIPTTISTLPQRVNGQIKPVKPERPIYRCESCSIPFYKKDVYEAHRLHYCSRRPSSGSEKEEETVQPRRHVGKPERQSPTTPADDRLVITYTCNKCSTSYRTIDTFKAHQCAVPHAPLPMLHCEECSFSTQSSRVLAEHIETHQKVNVMHKCKLCGYHGNTLRGMRQHGRQHMLKGEEFNDNDVETMELQSPKPTVSSSAIPVPYSLDVDEELLRLKNEPYKKRRSRKHYQKSEFMGVSPQRKENGLQHRSRSSSPHSTSTVSCTSPLQVSAVNVVQVDRSPCSSSTTVTVKQEPTESTTADSKGSLLHSFEHKPAAPDKQAAPVKRYVCSCNTSFASVSTFEAHKKLYCTHHKSQRNNPTIAVNH